MMKMLEAGGMPVLVDGIRQADRDNPRGYYEFERVKKLNAGDTEWLDQAQGRAVKIIAMLLYDLPSTHRYRVVFMRRRMPEILASQKQMLLNRGEDPDAVSDDEVARMFQGHLERLDSWLARRENVAILDVDYNELVNGGGLRYARNVNDFVGGRLDMNAMAGVVDADLYRHRVTE